MKYCKILTEYFWNITVLRGVVSESRHKSQSPEEAFVSRFHTERILWYFHHT